MYPIANAENRILGLYRDFASLRSCVDRLKALHFGNRDISVLFPEAVVSSEASSPVDSASTNVPLAFIGGTLGSLTYIRPERLGIIAAALVELGLPEGDAQAYEQSLRAGSLLACVRSSGPSCRENVLQAFVQTGAERVITAESVASPRLPVPTRLSDTVLIC